MVNKGVDLIINNDLGYDSLYEELLHQLLEELTTTDLKYKAIDRLKYHLEKMDLNPLKKNRPKPFQYLNLPLEGKTMTLQNSFS